MFLVFILFKILYLFIYLAIKKLRILFSMAKEDWAVKGRYLLKGIDDLKIQGEDEKLFPELFGYCDENDLREAIEDAKKIPKKRPKKIQVAVITIMEDKELQQPIFYKRF